MVFRSTVLLNTVSISVYAAIRYCCASSMAVFSWSTALYSLRSTFAAITSSVDCITIRFRSSSESTISLKERATSPISSVPGLDIFSYPFPSATICVASFSSKRGRVISFTLVTIKISPKSRPAKPANIAVWLNCDSGCVNADFGVSITSVPITSPL